MLKNPKALAWRVSLLYAGVAVSWILLSSTLLSKLVLNAQEIRHFEIYKGLGFVVGTALLLFFYVRTQLRKLEKESASRKKHEEALRVNMARLEQQEAGLIVLSKKEALPDGALPAALRRITEVSARTLGVERVSVWRFNPDRRTIRCADLYELRANQHSEGVELAVADYPVYFQMLAERDVIAADDACTDLSTREFVAGYLKPLGITSKMAASVQVKGVLDGMVCHEHIGPPRQWMADERTFAIAVANSVSLALEEWERKQAEKAFRQSQQAYAALVNTVNGIVWEADAQTFRFLFVSQMAERLLGYPVGNWLNDPNFWSDHLHPEDRDWALNYCVEFTQRKKDHDFRYRMIAADGRVVWLHDLVSVVVQSDQPVKLRGIMVDITSLKQAEERLRASEERLKEAQHMARIGSWTWQPDGNLIWSDTMFQLFGVPPDVTPTFEHFLAVVHPDEREQVDARFQGWIASDRVSDVVEYRLLLPDGCTRMIIAIGSLERDVQGRVIRAVGTCQDITERKRTEEDLRWRTALFEAQMDSSLDGILVVDSSGKKILQNQRMNELWKIPPYIVEDQTDAVQLEFAASQTKNRRQFADKVAYLYAHPDEVGRDEIELVDGTILDRYSAPVRDKVGKTYGRIWTFRDITEGRRAAQKLATEQARFKLIFDTIPIGIAFHTVHPDGHFTRNINAAHLRICGLTREEHDQPDIYGKISHPDDLVIQRRFNEQVKAGIIKQFSMEKRYHHPDGKVVWVNFSYQRETYPDGTIEELTTVVDITERKCAEAALRDSEQRFRQVTENIDEVFWLTDTTKNEMIYISPAYQTVWGRTCESLYVSPLSWMESIHPDDRTRVRNAALTLQAKGGYDLEYRIVHPDGAARWIQDRAFPIKDADGQVRRIAGVAKDITARRQLEEQLRQAQKMEAIGQLAGGVAHDFNNILAVIQLHASLMKTEPGLSPEQLEFADEIEKASQRAANLTRQLLLFSRKQVLQLCDFNLNESVTNITRMLQRILGEDVQMQLNFAPQSLMIHADTGMMDQMLMNLTVNARDAMPKGGRLIIETSAVEFNEATVAQSGQVRSGSFACLSVSDTGCGIPPENLSRIFEPFFTTKEVGKGTGLGLATVFGIVQQHQGWINVYSEAGLGTTFRIYLPRLSGISGEKNAWPPLASIRGGKETILLVEDDPSLRASIQITLSRLGYRVIEAPSGAEAVEVWKQHRDEIRLLLTDLVMPGGMTGRELAGQLLQQDPGLKVVYVSGYSAEIASKDFHVQAGVNFLAKPFETHTLAQTVRNRLDDAMIAT